jgi:hypothetical protein
VKAESGLDALTQAIESFCSRHATSITESLSFGAVAMLAADLETFVCANPHEHRDEATNVANASLMAGMAFSNSRLGLVHGLVHPLGVRTGAPHGRLCGILLPYALGFNRDAVPEQYALLCGGKTSPPSWRRRSRAEAWPPTRAKPRRKSLRAFSPRRADAHLPNIDAPPMTRRLLR